MRYISTRGRSGPVTVGDAFLNGLAPDGGLFLPESFPVAPETLVKTITDWNYQELASVILGLFLTDYTRQELAACIKKAYGEQFDTPAVTPVAMVGENLGFLELWHGPTCAFKDSALQLLPHLLGWRPKKANADRSWFF